MPDGIKDVIVGGDTLHAVSDSRIWSTRAEVGREPKQWKVIQYANVGTSEEFVSTFSGEISDLLNGTHMSQENREAARNAITTMLFEGLVPAFEHLKRIRASKTNPEPELNRRQHYEDFGRVLWHAYKDLFVQAVKLLGFDIGFAFTSDKEFEKGAIKFLKRSPNLIIDVPAFMRVQRKNWQQPLSAFRNLFLEHRKADWSQFAVFYEPRSAEMLFEHAWKTMAELLPVFMEARFVPHISLARVPEELRGNNNGRAWQCFFCEPVERGTFPDLTL